MHGQRLLHGQRRVLTSSPGARHKPSSLTERGRRLQRHSNRTPITAASMNRWSRDRQQHQLLRSHQLMLHLLSSFQLSFNHLLLLLSTHPCSLSLAARQGLYMDDVSTLTCVYCTVPFETLLFQR